MIEGIEFFTEVNQSFLSIVIPSLPFLIQFTLSIVFINSNRHPFRKEGKGSRDRRVQNGFKKRILLLNSGSFVQHDQQVHILLLPEQT